jgi:hypothetical protein
MPPATRAPCPHDGMTCLAYDNALGLGAPPARTSSGPKSRNVEVLRHAALPVGGAVRVRRPRRAAARTPPSEPRGSPPSRSSCGSFRDSAEAGARPHRPSDTQNAPQQSPSLVMLRQLQTRNELADRFLACTQTTLDGGFRTPARILPLVRVVGAITRERIRSTA